MYTEITGTIYDTEFDKFYAVLYYQEIPFNNYVNDEEDSIDENGVGCDEEFIPFIEFPEFDDTFDLASS